MQRRNVWMGLLVVGLLVLLTGCSQPTDTGEKSIYNIDTNKLINDGLMADTCNLAQKTSALLGLEVNGVTHNLICHNHLQQCLNQDRLQFCQQVLVCASGG